MANVRKRILQLTPLPSASLDTTIVGVDNGVTYRIELDVLADAVTSRVNILDRDRLNLLESVTSSFETKGRSVISSSAQITTLGFISTSVDLAPLNIFTQSIDARVGSLESATSSYLTSLNGTISSSAQIASFGFTSESVDISSLNLFTQSFSSSQNILNTAFINGISARLQTSSFNEYTASQSTSSLVDRLNSIENVSGSWITESETGSFLTSLNGAISSSSQLTSSFDTRYTLSGSIQNIELPSNLVSGSSQLTSSFDTRYTLSGSVQPLPNGLISGSSQLTSSYDSRYSLSGSVLTSFSSSVDTRLDTLEGTIISGSPNYIQILREPLRGVTTTGVIIISGSITTTGNPVQIMVTGDANPISTGWTRLQIFRDGNGIGGIVQVENGSNLNVPYCLNVIDTPSAGTYTYSMRTVSGIAGTFDFGEHNGPTLTAVELKTNTNLPSVNNTFTGNNTFRGITTFATVGGDEGGEVEFGVPQTNTTLSTRVVADVFRNTFRIYDGNTNGVYIDLSKAPTGANGELMHKASGFVNRGVDVTLGNLKARVAATGNASLQLSTVSGTYSVHGSGVYSQSGAIAGVTLSTQLSVTTTPTYIVAGYNFGVAGAVDTWNIVDTNLGIAWRITMIIGFGYNNNFISIERLH